MRRSETAARSRPTWLVDDVEVGGTLVSDGTLAGWGTEAPPIAGYTLQLVSIGAKDGKRATLIQESVQSGKAYSPRTSRSCSRMR